MNHLNLIKKKVSIKSKKDASKLALIRKQCQSFEAIG